MWHSVQNSLKTALVWCQPYLKVKILSVMPFKIYYWTLTQTHIHLAHVFSKSFFMFWPCVCYLRSLKLLNIMKSHWVHVKLCIPKTFCTLLVSLFKSYRMCNVYCFPSIANEINFYVIAWRPLNLPHPHYFWYKLKISERICFWWFKVV